MTRPRGFATWQPQRKTRDRLNAVNSVLAEYKDFLPLTIRQVFYRLVGTDMIDKTEKAYGNLAEMLNRARRAELIDMDAIRDDGFSGGFALRNGYTGPGEFFEETIERAEDYRRDRQQGQARRLVVWCEATGMVPQLERVASTYGVLVKSSGGFDSTTIKHGAGRMSAEVPIEVIHIGDHDPSGECMFDALAEDVTAFARAYGNVIEFYRLAVTPAQIVRYDLPTAPPKASTHQMKKRMVETTQAEALDPATLAGIVRAGIEARMDMDLFRLAVETEEIEREQVQDSLRQTARREC